MLQDLTYRIVKFWSSWNLCADLQETLKEAKTAAQLCGILSEQLRLLCSSARDLVPCSHCIGSCITTRHFVLSYSSLLQLQYLLHHNMACIIWVFLYIYIRSIWPQIVLEPNRRSTWTHCGGRICFSPPPAISLAKGRATAGVRRYRDVEGGKGNVGIRGYRGSGDG